MICVSLWPISVVLLDTTSVLGELGWKAYPINGVRRPTFDFSFSLQFIHCNLNKCMVNATSMGSVEYWGGLFHPCFGSLVRNAVTWKQIMSCGLLGGFNYAVQLLHLSFCPACRP